jgi:methylenetetrahydrofolate reductase (NADPH)
MVLNIKDKLTSGKPAVFVEAIPPKGIDISNIVTHMRHLKSKVDAVVIPDMDSGIMHMSAIAAAAVIRQQGLETIVHCSGRDKNRMALQGDLLAAHVLGIHNILVTQAEDMAVSDHQDAKPVNDLNEAEILEMARQLSDGSDLSGFELSGAPRIYAGYQVPPITGSDHLSDVIDDVKTKIEAGAQFLILPPVFDIPHYQETLQTFSALNIPIIASVFLLKNVGMARYISINDAAAKLPETLITRIRQAADREAECISIASEMIQTLLPGIQGVKISATGWEDRLPMILDSAGL